MNEQKDFTQGLTRKPRTRKAIIKYLTEHEHYDSNHRFTVSHNVKIRHLNWYNPGEHDGVIDHIDNQNRAYHALEEYNWHSSMADTQLILEEFGLRWNNAWMISSEGRSNGYFVLHDWSGHGICLKCEGDPDDVDTYSLRQWMDVVWDFDKTVFQAVHAFQQYVFDHPELDELIEEFHPEIPSDWSE